MPPGGFQTHNLSRRAAVDLSLRPRRHWDRHIVLLLFINSYPHLRRLILYCSSTSVTTLYLTLWISCSGNAFCNRRQADITAITTVCCDALLYTSSISLYLHSFSVSVIFNSPVSCKDCRMQINEWVWTIGRMILTEKLKYSEKNLSSHHVVHHKSQKDLCWIELVAATLRDWKQTTWATSQPFAAYLCIVYLTLSYHTS
jgi:hypothetical protein